MNQFEREEQQLGDDYAAGLISAQEYNRLLRELQREWREEARAAAEEAAEQAYRDTLDNW